MSVDFGYFHRRYINLDAIDDRVLGPADFDRFTVLTPGDPRIPVPGGTPLTLYDLKPTSIRTPDVVTTTANNYGGVSRSWNGIDFTADARVQGLLLQGGLSTGSLSSDRCNLAEQLPEMERLSVTAPLVATDLPLEFCKTEQNWLTQVKLIGAYTLPVPRSSWRRPSRTSRGWSARPGSTFTAAQISASLGRNPTQGPQTINIIPPGTNFGDRWNQFDLRFTKIFRPAGLYAVPGDVRHLQRVQRQHGCR